MLSNNLILYYPLIFLPSIFPSIRVFSNKLALRIKWPKYWSFNINPSNEYSRLISFRIDCLDLLTVQGTLKSLLQHHSLKATHLCVAYSKSSNFMLISKTILDFKEVQFSTLRFMHKLIMTLLFYKFILYFTERQVILLHLSIIWFLWQLWLLKACMLSSFSRVQLFVTLWTVALQPPLSMGFSRKEH